MSTARINSYGLYLTADGSPVVAVGQLVRSYKAHVFRALLEGLDADVLQDVFHPHARPHRVRHRRRPPREPEGYGAHC